MLLPITRLLVRYRAFFLALWVLCLIGGAAMLPRLRFEFSLHPLLKGDPTQVDAVRQFYRTFPPAEGHALVTATWDSPVTVDRFREAASWARELESRPEVRRVFSAASILDLRFQGFTLDEWARLGGTGDEPVKLGDHRGMHTLRGRYLSHDLHSVAFHVEKDRGSFDRFIDALDETSAAWPGVEVRVLGTTVVLEDMLDILKSNLVQLVGIEIVALLVILPIFFRSFRTAYLPILTAVTGLTAYFAILVAADQAIGLIYLAGPLLILVIGLSDAIHLQQKFDAARAEGLGVAESIEAMLRSVGAACVLTSLTTALGFLSLGLAGHEEVRDFGFWCAVGVAVAFVTVMLFLPVALVFSPGKGTVSRHRTAMNPGVIRRLAIPALLFLTVIAAGIAFVEVDSSITQELPPDTKSVQDLEWFAENFQGSGIINVDVAATLEDPAVFAAVERLQSELEKIDGVIGSNSYASTVRFLLPDEVVNTKDGPYLGLQAIGGMNPFPANLLTRKGDRACLIFYTSNRFGSNEFGVLEKRFHELAATFPPGTNVALAGYASMAYHSVNLITRTLFRSFGISLLTITIVLAVALRSPTLALLCMLPNALPILVAAGLAGWLDIPLRMGVLIVFSVGLGLAVDDTIHFIVRFRQLKIDNPAATVRDLLDETLRSAGFAIILTSVVLLVAAAAFLKSDFSTMRETGIILGTITVGALIADLIILPWLIERFAKIKSLRTGALAATSPST